MLLLEREGCVRGEPRSELAARTCSCSSPAKPPRGVRSRPLRSSDAARRSASRVRCSRSARPTASANVRSPSAREVLRTSSATSSKYASTASGVAANFGAQLRPLRRDPDRAGVEVARPHHQAALCDQQRRAERDLIGTEQRSDDDVTARSSSHRRRAAGRGRAGRSSTSVALRLGEAELPRRARVLDRRQRARARAAVSAGDVDDVCERLDDARGDESDARPMRRA